MLRSARAQASISRESGESDLQCSMSEGLV
jgi:hypothetical protein